jgi:hypothetical protein
MFVIAALIAGNIQYADYFSLTVKDRGSGASQEMI